MERDVRVDPEDEWLLCAFVWRINSFGYVVRMVDKPKTRSVLLHREIAGAKDGEEVDHIDGDPSNNCRANLRVCTRAENSRNRRRHKNNKSGFKGVYLDNRRRASPGWRAQIRYEHKVYRLGTFPSPEEAHAAYVAAAKRLHGDFARAA